MSQPALCAERSWKFERLDQQWMWTRRTPHGGSIARGPFADLAQCMRDARVFGFDEANWERRNVPRSRHKAGEPFEY